VWVPELVWTLKEVLVIKLTLHDRKLKIKISDEIHWHDLDTGVHENR